MPVPHIVDGPFQLGETLLTPLPVPHGRSMVNGYLFSREGEKLVAYLCDCSAVPDEIVREIAGVKVLIIDALRHKPHPTHLSVSQALEVAAKVRPSQTLFTHICHELPQASEAELPAGVGMAYDGLKLKTLNDLRNRALRPSPGAARSSPRERIEVRGFCRGLERADRLRCAHLSS